MREIKFRAFIKHLHWTLPVESIDFIGKMVEVDLSGGEGDTSWYTFDEVELIQYAGLKDKYGREIYEGDIMPVNGQNCIVVYHEEYARFCLQMKSGRMFIPSKNSVVIGNHFENPELQEEVK